MVRRIVLFAAVAVGVIAVAVLVFAAAGGVARFGRFHGRGEGSGAALPGSVVAARTAEQTRAARAAGLAQPRRILFGDLHVHTTFSIDAFLWALPMSQGEGLHPPMDACDFARFCSGLDFWSINDHAEDLTPARWAETVEAVRQCNAVAGDPASPDLVTFLGWEWTQIGQTPDTHFGHQNVIVRGVAGDEVPARPIAARRELAGGRGPMVRRGPAAALQMSALALAAPGDRQVYYDLARYVRELAGAARCPDGVHVRDLPGDCMEDTPTPAGLFRKLDEWGLAALVIPHGTTWGYYTPAGSTFDKHLAGGNFGAERQPLIEVFSGHGNSEEYRDWRGVEIGPDGARRCPEPSADHLPSCWRAGEIIRARCRDAGESERECEARAAEARRLYVEAGQGGHRVVPGATPFDWLDSGQCRDCFMPAFNYRPGGSVQYALAIRSFDDPAAPRRFRFGFIASSDNHGARPGTGYKEFDRLVMTEAGGGVSETWADAMRGPRGEPQPRAVPFEVGGTTGPFTVWETERQASFFLTGGLVAVHAAGRDRRAVWDALRRKEVYGTSGDRILLWFDLLNAPGGRERPMGASVAMAEPPRFRVRAVGALEQKPGCPDHSTGALDAERLHALCRGECYNPGERRRRIARVEVVRIRPQLRPGEPVAPLIEDPWRTFACPPDPAGCAVTFDDPDFARGGRDAVYYVRALQEPSPAVNGANLRCVEDEAGRCLEVRPCLGDFQGDPDDDCLADVRERAWSSPIFVDFEAAGE